MSTDASSNDKFAATIADIGHALKGLDPGPLADLRRLSFADGAPAMFWRLRARHEFPKSQEAAWARIIQMMAILTEKGEPASRASPHALGRSRRLGALLCDGGAHAWNGAADRPLLSEQRLARLLAAKGEMRAELLERAIRTLATAKPPHTPVDCRDIARLVLWPDDDEPPRSVARAYYDRFDQRSKDDDRSGDAA